MLQDIERKYDIGVTVSLTTTSYRVRHTHRTVKTLLAQSYRPAHVVLWLSEHAHLKDSGVTRDDVPDTLAELEPHGLRIAWTHNTGPFRKLLPAMREYGGVIVTADDDTLYPEDWLEKLVAAHLNDPACICCYRGRRMRKAEDGRFLPYRKWRCEEFTSPSRYCFPTGKDGVLYPPGSLHDEVYNERAFMELCPTNDDIWFKAMSMLGNTLVKQVGHHRDFPVVFLSGVSGLFISRNMTRNDAYIQRVFSTYQLA